ncbi:endonuclease domain-containing 1 protein-like [Astyanax mexicanus]|uniref:Endonuclease domain-containing 1 protein-like n=1 Tax=Astyanax mexicanus TaxID=7994 RepID=A0A8T2KSM0_ASTMX|nr:endonuclease domain-containing 1 protein-like [Astyanax mexicanus]
MKLFAVLLLLGMFSLSVAEVVDSFKDTCPQFFIRDKKNRAVPPTVTSRPKYRQICQFYKGDYRFATLYDTKFKIPVYSAYTYSFTESGDIKGPWDWKIEPQLDDPNKGEDMKTEEEEKELGYRFQAQKKDYENTSYTMGHVFPRSYARSDPHKESTFTLTNAAPQTEDSNKQWVEKVEEEMLKKIKGNCDRNSFVYIVSGVVPGDKKWLPITREVGGETIDHGVNIPSHFWTAYSCKSKKKRSENVSNAYIAEQITPLFPENLTVDNLNKRLRSLYEDDQFSVFGKIKQKQDKGKFNDEL